MKLLMYLVVLITTMTCLFGQSSLDSVVLATSEIEYLDEQSDSIAQFTSNGIGYNIDQKTVKAQNTSTIDEVLRLVPAIHIKNYGGLGGLKTISVRGLGAQHTGLLLNGNLISDQKSGQVDLSIVPVQSISFIDFNIGDVPNYYVPAKAYTYNNTLAIGEKLKYRLGEKKSRIVLGSGFGSFSSFNPFLQLTHKIDSSQTVGVVYEGLMSKGNYTYQSIEGQEKVRDNNDFIRNNVKLLYEKNSASHQVNMQAFVLHKRQNLPGAEILHNPQNNQELEDWNSSLLASKIWKKKSVDFFVRGNLNYQFTHYLDTNYHNQAGHISSEYNQSNFSGSFGLTKYFGNVIAFAAADIDYSLLKSNNIQNDAHRVSNFFTGGIEYTKNKFKVKGFITNTLVSDKSSISKLRHNLSGFLGVNYALIKDKLVSKLFYKSSYRMPSFNDLYYNNIGNEDLEPEQSDQLNLAFSSLFKLGFLQRVSLNLSSFYGIVNNKIVAVPTQNLFIWSMQNIGKVRNYGGEFSLNILTNHFFKHLSIKADFAYTLQQNKDITNPEDLFYTQQIRYTPQEIVNGRITLQHQEKLSLYWNSQFIGHQFYLPQNTYGNLIQEVLLHELGASYKIDFKKKQMLFQFSIRNLIDEQYQLVRGFPMQGRNYWGTLTLMI